MKIHETAEIFPMLEKAEMQELAESIKKEGLLNPCVKQGDVLLDGRNRLAACKLAGVEPRLIEYTGESPVAFIISSNLVRRHLDKGQKIALALDIEPLFAKEARRHMAQGGAKAAPGRPVEKGMGHCPIPIVARDQAARTVGVSGKLVSAAKAIREADSERFQKVKAGKLSVAKAKKEIKAEHDRRALAEAQETITAKKRQSLASVCDLRVCSCADLFRSGIRPDAVINDPPYSKEFLPVFTELAEGCKLAGVPLVAVMCGQSYSPEVMLRLREHLRYRWKLAYLTPGGQAVQQWPAKINSFWKPVLLFGDAVDWLGDVVASKPNDNDKRFHHWGQSESGMADLVERLTKPGQLVCDPFLGGGTTAVVSLALGRRFVGCDIDPDSVDQARARVMI